MHRYSKAVATPIPPCLGLGSYTSGSPAIVEAWFYGLQRGWSPEYSPTFGFHLVYKGNRPLEKNSKTSYAGLLPGVAVHAGLVPALPRSCLEISLSKGAARTPEGQKLVCTLLGPAALINVGCVKCVNVGLPSVQRFDGYSKFISCKILKTIQPGQHALMNATCFEAVDSGFVAGLNCPQCGCPLK